MSVETFLRKILKINQTPEYTRPYEIYHTDCQTRSDVTQMYQKHHHMSEELTLSKTKSSHSTFRYAVSSFVWAGGHPPVSTSDLRCFAQLLRNFLRLNVGFKTHTHTQTLNLEVTVVLTLFCFLYWSYISLLPWLRFRATDVSHDAVHFAARVTLFVGTIGMDYIQDSIQNIL